MPEVLTRTPIHLLPQDVAERIAAGEVIERPVSVVKELVENALDAGSHEIRVEIRGSGLRLVRVTDDGNGIPEDELERACARHTTSKINTLEDLGRLHTLGFRGEALASIAAVSSAVIPSEEAFWTAVFRAERTSEARPGSIPPARRRKSSSSREILHQGA